MNDITQPRLAHPRELVLLLGSNIDPELNLKSAVEILEKEYGITRKSGIWESLPVGSSGGNYLNQAVGILTDLPLDEIRYKELRKIESKLGRERGADKYAPRTMDIDVIVDQCQIIDDKIWQYAFICVPVAQLEPDMTHPETLITLATRSAEMKTKEWIVERDA